MKQIEFFDIPSPCINVCQAGARGYCVGCYRSREERQHWHLLESDIKRKIIKACVLRKKRAARRNRVVVQDNSDSAQLDLWQDD